MQSVLLQGYLYITQNHVCFYAYLPKKSVSQPKYTLDLQELMKIYRMLSLSLDICPKGANKIQSLIDTGLFLRGMYYHILSTHLIFIFQAEISTCDTAFLLQLLSLKKRAKML